MKKLNNKKSSLIIAGDRAARLFKQQFKCEMGSMRACRRAARISDRMN